MKEGITAPSPEGESEHKIERWGYETRFRYYLYRLFILGNEGVESIANFPARIELDDVWQNTLNRMRDQSRDGIERGIPVGRRVGSVHIYLPQQFWLGTSTRAFLPSERETRENFGIERCIGLIHSHPNDRLSRCAWRALEATKLVKGSGFSLEDLFYLVNGSGLPFEAVVEKNENFFAFRTQETVDIPPASPFSMEEKFASHWYRKHGIVPVFNNRFGVATRLRYDLQKMNLSLAAAYKLALYRGKPGEDLVREYPLLRE